MTCQTQLSSVFLGILAVKNVEVLDGLLMLMLMLMLVMQE